MGRLGEALLDTPSATMHGLVSYCTLLCIACYAGLNGGLLAMGLSLGGAARCNAIRRSQPQTQQEMLAAGRCGSCPAQRDQATSTAKLPGRWLREL
jgi:hypothetical protein